MAIGILAAVLVLLFGTAAIIVPRIVNRHNGRRGHRQNELARTSGGG